MPLPENLAANPNDFLDYYNLLDQPADATTAAIRGRINDLYAEAQANRDHRNAQKRREYLLWLDLLPGARSILTDETKRAKYDEYRQKLQAGESVPAYLDFLRVVEGKPAKSEEEAQVLGLRTETPKTPEPVAKPLPTSGGGSSSTAGIAALVVLIIAAVIGIAMKQAAFGLIGGAILGGIVFMIMRGSGNKVSR